MQKRGDVKGELPQSRLTPRQLPQGGREQTLSGAPAPAPPKGELFVIFRLAQIKLPLSGTTSPGRGKMAKPERGTAGERSEPERVLPAARLFPQETSAADAAFLHDPTRENAMPGGPQTARHCSIINNSSAEYAQSSAERIPIVFLRTAPQPPDAPAKRTAMPRRTGSPP